MIAALAVEMQASERGSDTSTRHSRDAKGDRIKRPVRDNSRLIAIAFSGNGWVGK